MRHVVAMACAPRAAAWLALAVLLAGGAAIAQAVEGATAGDATPRVDAPAAGTSEQVLDTVHVLAEGDQFGPGLWLVTRGENRLWLLGTQSPLLRRMTWNSDHVEALVAESQLLIGTPFAAARVGVLQGMMLAPGAMRARRNPGGASLDQVLPAELYARWSVQRERYLPRNRRIEKWRPLFAAAKLYEAAIEASGLEQGDRIWQVVRKAARRHDVEIVVPTVDIRIEAPRQALREFARDTLDDERCMALTLERLETDIAAMRQRANAWAIGDIEALADLPAPDQRGACTDAILGSTVGEKQGLDEIPARLTDAWFETIDGALAEHRQTVAVLPMDRLLGDDGIIAALRRRGYEVIDPE